MNIVPEIMSYMQRCHKRMNMNIEQLNSGRNIEIRIIAEENGFYGYVAQLAGVVSQGATETETLQNVQKALYGTLVSYKDNNMSIPWRKPDVLKKEEKRFTILLNA